MMDISKICDERLKKYKKHYNMTDGDCYFSDAMIEVKTLNVMDNIKSGWVKQLSNEKKSQIFALLLLINDLMKPNRMQLDVAQGEMVFKYGCGFIESWDD